MLLQKWVWIATVMRNHRPTKSTCMVCEKIIIIDLFIFKVHICAGIIASLTISLALNVLIVAIFLSLLMKIVFMRVKRRTSISQAPNQALYSEGIIPAYSYFWVKFYYKLMHNNY